MTEENLTLYKIALFLVVLSLLISPSSAGALVNAIPLEDNDALVRLNFHNNQSISIGILLNTDENREFIRSNLTEGAL